MTEAFKYSVTPLGKDETPLVPPSCSLGKSLPPPIDTAAQKILRITKQHYQIGKPA